MFQTIMNNIFTELIDEGTMIIYMDDTLIFHTAMEQHHAIV